VLKILTKKLSSRFNFRLGVKIITTTLPEYLLPFSIRSSVHIAVMRVYGARAVGLRSFCRDLGAVGAWSKAWVCGHTVAGTAGSNPAGGMEVRLL
jgi:hypothetical protein